VISRFESAWQAVHPIASREVLRRRSRLSLRAALRLQSTGMLLFNSPGTGCTKVWEHNEAPDNSPEPTLVSNVPYSASAAARLDTITARHIRVFQHTKEIKNVQGRSHCSFTSMRCVGDGLRLRADGVSVS
jgi:hypothetical protein